MDEKAISQRTRDFLRTKGFFVLRHSDSFTTGIPDMSVHANGKTLWVEDKYLSVQMSLFEKPVTVLDLTEIKISARMFITKKRQVQLLNMVKLEVHSLAQYWLYVEAHGLHFISILSPRVVFDSFYKDAAISIELRKVDEWRRQFNLV